MSRYRVIGKGFKHGLEGELLSKEEVRKKHLNVGRGDAWYEGWDLILGLDEDDPGYGFNWDEVELIYESICASCDAPIEERDYLCLDCRKSNSLVSREDS